MDVVRGIGLGRGLHLKGRAAPSGPSQDEYGRTGCESRGFDDLIAA